MGRLFHFGYTGRSPTVTGKEGSSKFAFTAKCEQHGGERVQEICQRCQERFRVLHGRGNQLCPGEDWKHPRNIREACSEQPETKPPAGFRAANSVRALLVTRPILPNREQDLCSASLLSLWMHPSLYIIFPLAPSNSSALLHILPCQAGTWARTAKAHWMQWRDSLPATAKESYQGQSLAYPFLLSVSTHPCLSPSLPVEVSNNKKILGI